jgi:hypothetical protein
MARVWCPLLASAYPAGVAEHMRMCLQLEAGTGGSTLDHPGEAGCRERGSPLANKDKRRRLALALEPAQGPELVARHRPHRSLPCDSGRRMAPSRHRQACHRSCDSRTASSLAICRPMEVVTHALRKKRLRGSGLTQQPIRGHANGGQCNDSSSPRSCDRDGQMADSASARWSIAHRYAKIVPWMIDRHIV